MLETILDIYKRNLKVELDLYATNPNDFRKGEISVLEMVISDLKRILERIPDSDDKMMVLVRSYLEATIKNEYGLVSEDVIYFADDLLKYINKNLKGSK